MSTENIKYRKGNTYMQWMLALLANGGTLSYGLEVGWMSPTARLLQSENSPTGNILSDTDVAWIASIMNLSAVVGAVLFRHIADGYGRKAAMLSLALPQLLSWILKIAYPTTITLIISRVFGGIAASGVFMVAPIYVKEISEDSIRGSLAIILPISQYIGVIVIYVLGAYLDYYHVVYCVIGIPVLVTLLTLRAPESPNYLVKEGRIDEALECVAFLRGLDKTDSRVRDEVENMQKTDSINKKLPEISTFELMKDKKWRKWVFFIGIVFTLRGWNGSLSIQTYALSALLSTGVTYNISPEVLTFSFPCVMIVIALLLTLFVDRFERKRLLCLAHLVTCASMLTLAVATLLQHHGTDIPSWLPVVAIMMVSAMFAAGVSPLPYVLVTEMFHFEIRAKVILIISVYGWFSIFIMTFLHPILINQIGSSGTYVMYGALNLFAAMFVIIFLPKTRGKSEEEIRKVMGTN